MPAAPKGPFVSLRDALRQTTALKGIAEVMLGNRSSPKNTAPWRVVLYPTGGSYIGSSDKPNNACDLKQNFRAELWAKGQTNDPDSDYDACWYLHTRFLQAMDEQARDWMGTGAAGFYYEGLVPAWNTDTDTSAQGVALGVAFTVQLPVPAAAGDEGHVGEAWPQGTAEETTFEVTQT
jgi:hypothetical protein